MRNYQEPHFQYFAPAYPSKEKPALLLSEQLASEYPEKVVSPVSCRMADGHPLA